MADMALVTVAWASLPEPSPCHDSGLGVGSNSGSGSGSDSGLGSGSVSGVDSGSASGSEFGFGFDSDPW